MQENVNITKLKVQVEGKRIIEECLNEMVKRKTNECIIYEQEVVTLRLDMEKVRVH
jgi:hypothetical protein